MKKRAILATMTISFCICISACGTASSGTASTNQYSSLNQPTPSSALSSSSEKEPSTMSSTESSSASSSIDTSMPSPEELYNKMAEALVEIGADDITGEVEFNEDSFYDSDSLMSVTLIVPTKHRDLDVEVMYIYDPLNKWSVSRILDHDDPDICFWAGKLSDAYDIYDYVTGELKQAKTKSLKEIQNEAASILS